MEVTADAVASVEQGDGEVFGSLGLCLGGRRAPHVAVQGDEGGLDAEPVEPGRQVLGKGQ